MLKTLIVDDIAVFRETFKTALRERFPAMTIAEEVDGSQVVDKVKAFQPDLVFMDIRLPGENGLALTEKIKVDCPGIVIIILTDYDLPEYREAALQGGADEFIPKGSLKMSAIEALIERHLAGKL